MEPFKDILAAGGHTNSLGRAGEVLGILQNDPSRLGELFDCISSEDAWVRMRAIDTFEKLVKDNPALAQSYLDPIFADVIHSDQPSIQWHLAQIFAEVELNKQQRGSAIAWLKKMIATTDVDWIVSVNTMKALLYFCKKGLVEGGQLEPLFEVQAKHRSKSVRKKAAAFKQELKAESDMM